MEENYYHIKNISVLHELMGLSPPQHPLISVVDAAELGVSKVDLGKKLIYDFYMISLKDKSCSMSYGRNSFDFDEGVMVFSAPRQVYSPTIAFEKGTISGWLLFVHPDLFRNTALGNAILDYSFFNYEVFEALHLSKIEEEQINTCVQNIIWEYKQRIDAHSQKVILSNLSLLLDYSNRFYERQFHTRTNQNKDIVMKFEKSLKAYFNQHSDKGSPAIAYFAEKVHLSPHYFSDLIKKETGRSPKEHINDFIIDKAKVLLANSSENINHIAYDLGFNYPHYFIRLFRRKTGLTPNAYRNSLYKS
ncbi:MAG: helix-turn-helix transcriptional regulator [Flavobacteriaceae bacterium]|nr:helix-turn-helix transcriptional regulator [Flavobacteriaceae bacterium]